MLIGNILDKHSLNCTYSIEVLMGKVLMGWVNAVLVMVLQVTVISSDSLLENIIQQSEK